MLIVDDSVYLRHTLSKRLEADPDIEVVGYAIDGLDALDRIPALKPDVVILDVEMPRMDGLTALQEIMVRCPTPVIMLSAHTQRGARTTVQALIRGAVDFVPKPTSSTGMKEVVAELIAKVKMAARTSVSLFSGPQVTSRATPGQRLEPQPLGRGDPLIVIGASTGGPRALEEILCNLPAGLPAAIAIVQHMPAGFTRSLAQRLDEHAALAVREARQGDRLARGLALLAPGDFHLRIGKDGSVDLDQGPTRNHVRPAVDVSMESAAEHYGPATLGVVLTGMGCDGTQGASRIKAAGGRVLAEHESTCVVYGMPRSVAEASLADRVVPLPQIAPILAEWVS